MKIVADESVEYNIILYLREKGIDVYAIRENDRGIDDETVLSIAFNSDSLLLTMDKDFGYLAYRLGKSNHGIVLCRFNDLTNAEKAHRVYILFDTYKDKLWSKFAVLHNNRVGINDLPIL